MTTNSHLTLKYAATPFNSQMSVAQVLYITVFYDFITDLPYIFSVQWMLLRAC